METRPLAGNTALHLHGQVLKQVMGQDASAGEAYRWRWALAEPYNCGGVFRAKPVAETGV